ncbi:MAG: hypothetical protein Q9204_000656, partial [Flavoplaca sp. TL-2023a]
RFDHVDAQSWRYFFSPLSHRDHLRCKIHRTHGESCTIIFPASTLSSGSYNAVSIFGSVTINSIRGRTIIRRLGNGRFGPRTRFRYALSLLEMQDELNSNVQWYPNHVVRFVSLSPIRSFLCCRE